MAKWTREEIIVAYALYCITPLNKINMSNALIKQVSETFGHSQASLVMRMQNFTSIDPRAQKKGLSNVAKADKQIFEEFKNDWGALSIQAEEITGLNLFDADPINGAKPLSSLTNHRKVSRERHCFRASVFAAYNNVCCISGVKIPGLLVASHIKPYSKCRTSTERTEPGNGLLLNTFYDKAFDAGLITVTPNYKIHISKEIKDESEFTKTWLLDLQGKEIFLPDRFYPEKDYLEFHNDRIFRG